ncbi:MAG: hypothetical protein M3548_05340 [Actinomycetota bacterium]|nr:hypothetical protein [Actinomycetota bacterium]
MRESPGRVICCTVTPSHQLGAAVTLARSYLAHHSDHRFLIVNLDGDGSGTEGGLTIAGFDRLGLDDRFFRLATAYGAEDLAMAVRPALLRQLISEYDVALYIQPQSKVFAPLAGIADHARSRGVVLTPRNLAALPLDGKTPAAASSFGLVDTGFLAVGQGGLPFLDYLDDVPRRHALTDPKVPLRSEQILLDSATTLFQHKMIRDSAFTIAYWNAHERTVASRDNVPIVDGEALQLVQFVDFDPDRPWLFSSACAERPRVLLSENTALRVLCADYRQDVLPDGAAPDYRFDYLPGGDVLTSVMRGLFRQAWDKDAATPPHPFGDDAGSAFRQWLCSTDSPVEQTAGLNRLVMGLWRNRVDLQVAFGQPSGPGAHGFRTWCRTHGTAEGEVPSWAAPREPDAVEPPVADFGVNVAGYLTAELGLGQMGRLIHDVIRHANVPLVSVVEEQALSCRTGLPQPDTTGRPRYPVSLLAVNSDYTRLLVETHPELTHERYRIGLGAWELE